MKKAAKPPASKRPRAPKSARPVAAKSAKPAKVKTAKAAVTASPKVSVSARLPQATQVVSCAPGRINLIGEHTDYNGGFVLPMAIDRYTKTKITVLPIPDKHIQVRALDLNQMFTWIEGAFPLEAPSFARYVHGACVLMREEFRDRKLPGLAVDISSTVPMGAGLSSSAALSVALLQGIAEAAKFPLKRDRIPLLAQANEHRFIGTKCGIMDMYVSVHAKAGHALFLDCKSLKSQQIKINASKVAILAADSGVKHELSDGGYNRIRNECESAARKLLGHDGLLRDVPLKLQDGIKKGIQKGTLAALTDSEYLRARHVIGENERVKKAIRYMQANKWAEVGQLFYQSHRSMKIDFSITCSEVDRLVDTASTLEGVYGARMTGGGFGGSVVVLTEPKMAEAVAEALTDDYKSRFGLPLKVHRFLPAAGAYTEK